MASLTTASFLYRHVYFI